MERAAFAQGPPQGADTRAGPRPLADFVSQG